MFPLWTRGAVDLNRVRFILGNLADAMRLVIYRVPLDVQHAMCKTTEAFEKFNRRYIWGEDEE